MNGLASSTLMGIVEDHSRGFELRLDEINHARYTAGERYLRIQQDLIDYLSPIVPEAFWREPGASNYITELLQARRADYNQLLSALADQEQDIAKALASAREVRAQREALDQQAVAGLEQTPEYQQLTQQLQQAQAASRQAERDYAEVSDECAAKLPAFEANPIFAFLHNRGLGTEHYAAGPLARVFDGWLAKRVNYRINLENQRILLEMQGYNEVRRQEQQAGEQALRGDLLRVQSGFLRKTGKEALNTKQKILARQIAAAKQRARHLHDQLSPFVYNEDEHLEAGLKWLNEQTGGKDLLQLLDELQPVLASTPKAGTRLKSLCGDHDATLQELESCYDRQAAAEDAYTLAKALENGLRDHLFGALACDADCDCPCHAGCSCGGCADEACNCPCHQRCGCDYNYDSHDQFDAALDIDHLLSSYMKRDISLEYLLSTLDAQRIACPAPSHEHVAAASCAHP